MNGNIPHFKKNKGLTDTDILTKHLNSIKDFQFPSQIHAAFGDRLIPLMSNMLLSSAYSVPEIQDKEYLGNSRKPLLSI